MNIIISKFNGIQFGLESRRIDIESGQFMASANYIFLRIKPDSTVHWNLFVGLIGRLVSQFIYHLNACLTTSLQLNRQQCRNFNADLCRMHGTFFGE